MAGFEALAQLGIEFTSKTAAKAEKDILGVERAADRAEQSMEELSARSKKLATDLANAGKSGRKATDDLNNLRLATNRVEASTQSVTARFDKMFASVGGGQMAMRQTAFQLNQIAQQGAVTGNYMGALAVQSADILTVFGMWGILAGGAIAVMGPFITSLFSSGDAVKELDGLLQGASETLGEYRQSAELAAMSTEELERRFGSAGASMKTLMTVLDDLKARAAQRSIDEVSASISELLAVAGDGEKRGAIADFFDVNIFLAFTDKARDARDTARELTGEFLSAQKALDYAATIEKSTDRLNAQIDGTQRLLDVSIQLADADGLRTKAEDDLITKIAESLKQMRMLQGATEDASLIDKKRRATAQEMMDQYARQAEMANTIAAYGKDSAEAELLKRAEAIRTAEAMIEQKGLSGDVAEQVLKAAMAAYDAEANSAKAAVALRDAETAAKGLASAIASAAGFSLSLENGVRVLEAQVTALKNGADAAIASTIETMKIKAEQMKQDQIKAGVDKVIAEAQYALDMVAIADQEKLLGQKNALTEATKKAASAGSKHARQLERELEAVRKSLSPLSAYNEELGKLTKLRGYLTDDEFAQAIRNLNVELADSLPLVGDLTDSVVEGLFNGFDGTLDSIKSIFKSWLVEMISMAAKNQIVMSMGLSSTGAVASGVAGAAGGGGTGSLGVIGQLAGIGGSIFSGASGLLSSLFGAGGGIGAAGTYLSSVLGTATSSIGAFGAAIGAIALPVAAVAAVFSFFSTKTKLLDSGLRITADNMDLLIQSFSTVEKSKFWGLSKKVSTSYGEVDAETAAVLGEAIGGIMTSVRDAAAVLGIGGKAFRDFAYIVEVSTKGMTDEEAQQAILDAMTDLSDAYAGMVPNIEQVAKTGEGATDTLTRLSTSLTTVNDLADLLGHRLFDVSLVGADAASRLVDYFGDLDTMTGAVTTYWQTVYSESEQTETAVRRLTSTFEALGYAMPRSRAQYRALVDSIDTSTDAGMELYATMISLAGAMDAVLPTVASITAELEALTGSTQTGLEAYITAAEAAAKANASAASDWYKASDNIRTYIDKLRGSSTSLTSPMQARAYNEANYQTTLAAALAGDLTAAGNLTSVAESLRSSVNDTASTRVEAALAEARILSDLTLAAGVGDVEGARYDVISGLLQDQADLAQDMVDYIAAGNALTEEQIDTLKTQLGSLDDAIAAAELINYAYLKERLQVTVDVLADADVPAYLKTLLGNAANGVEGYIDFLVRSDLSPDLKWLALTGASEHVATIEYVAEHGQITDDLLAIATSSAGTYVTTVKYLAKNLLSSDLMALALDDASTLLKSIEWVVGALPDDIKSIVLNDIDALTKVINLRAGATVDAMTATLALADAKEFKRILNVVAGNIVTGDVQALALDDPQGFRRTLNIIAGNLPSGKVQTLALNAASDFTRVLNFQLGKTPEADVWRTALATTSTLQKTVNMMVGAKLDADTMRLALAGNSELSRVVNATLAADIDKQAKRLALGNLGAYSVSVMASLSPAVSTRVRQIVFGEQGTYAAVIEAAISSDMTAAARRILLTRQGDYIANITGVLVSSMTNSVRELLLEANTAAVRSVTIRKVWADSLTRDEKSLLRDAETTAMRTIRAAVQMAGVSVDGMLFLTQISAGKTDFQKSLIGKIALGTLGADEKRLLRAADSYVTTLIKGSYDLSSIRASTRATKLLDAVDQVFGSKLVASFDLGAVSNARRQRLLDATGLSFVSKLVAGFDLAGIDSARKRALLDADDLTLTSTLTGKYDIAKLLSSDRAKVLLDANSLNFTSTLFGKSDLRAVSADALALLGAKTSSITKTLLGVDKSGGISGNGWTLLKAVTSSITKTIQGKVDLSGLTDRQKSLLDAITGATVGKVTLGGSFVFDPSTSFETLLGGSIEAPMDAARLAMGTLTGALDDLRSAIAAETARAEYESKVAALQMQGSAAASALASTKALQSSTADDLTALFASLGVSTVGGSVKVKNGQLTETYDHLVTSGSWEPLMKALRSNYGVKGGTVAELMSAIFDQVNSPLAGQQTTLKDLRAAYRKLTGEAPSFATGGDHRGGFAHIGENDLELVAPSRIYNPGETKAMLDNREVIAELKALRAEVKQLRDEQRQLDISRNNDLRKLRTIEERREAEA